MFLCVVRRGRTDISCNIGAESSRYDLSCTTGHRADKSHAPWAWHDKMHASQKQDLLFLAAVDFSISVGQRDAEPVHGPAMHANCLESLRRPGGGRFVQGIAIVPSIQNRVACVPVPIVAKSVGWRGSGNASRIAVSMSLTRVQCSWNAGVAIFARTEALTPR